MIRISWSVDDGATSDAGRHLEKTTFVIGYRTGSHGRAVHVDLLDGSDKSNLAIQMSRCGVDQSIGGRIHTRRRCTDDHQLDDKIVADLQILQLAVGANDGRLIPARHNRDSIGFHIGQPLRVDVRIRNEDNLRISGKMLQS